VAGKSEGLLAEYASLRREIADAKNVRILTLGFTLAFVGGALGEIAGTNSTAAAAVCLLIVALALVITTHSTRAIEVNASYLRRYVEPLNKGLNWETRLDRRRRTKPSRSPIFSFSKSLALAYGVITGGIDLGWLYSSNPKLPWEIALVAAVSAVCGLLALDLYFWLTKGWKIEWTDVPEPGATSGKPPTMATR
jgi:uncharacterized membrane protein YfcA